MGISPLIFMCGNLKGHNNVGVDKELSIKTLFKLETTFTLITRLVGRLLKEVNGCSRWVKSSTTRVQGIE